MRHRQTLGCAATLLIAATLGCTTDRVSAPSRQNAFDVTRALADLAAVRSAIGQSQWQSLSVAATRLNAPSVAASVVAATAALSAEDARAGAVAMARQLMALTVDRDNTPSTRALPQSVLGHTFVFDPARGRYVVDLSRAGAPPNGIRIVLYAVDPTTHEPVTASEIGFADLMDESATQSSGIVLHLIAEASGRVFLDYRVVLDGTPSAGSLLVDGTTFDGETHVGFHMEAHGVSSGDAGAMNLQFQFVVPERGFAVMGNIIGIQSAMSGGQSQMHLRIATGAAVIGLDAMATDEFMDATFTVNGRLFANLHGDPRNPAIRGEGDRALTPDEMEALGQMAELAGNAMAMFGNLLAPVSGIVNLTRITS